MAQVLPIEKAMWQFEESLSHAKPTERAMALQSVNAYAQGLNGSPAQTTTTTTQQKTTTRGRSRRRARGKGEEMTRWVADKNARRVPNFVMKATHLDTKEKIVAKYGANAVFEVGKPLPQPIAQGAKAPIQAVGAKKRKKARARAKVAQPTAQQQVAAG